MRFKCGRTVHLKYLKASFVLSQMYENSGEDKHKLKRCAVWDDSCANVDSLKLRS